MVLVNVVSPYVALLLLALWVGAQHSWPLAVVTLVVGVLLVVTSFTVGRAYEGRNR